MIRIPEHAIAAIREHGRESYRDEACGVMYGVVEGGDKHVRQVARLHNAREDERHRRFVVTAEDYRRVEAEATRIGLSLLGFYHSHPDHPAYPSEYDREHAFPFFSYVILSVEDQKPKALRSFVLSDGRDEFVEEKVEKESSSCP